MTTPDEEAHLISIGMDLGVYAMAKLFAGGKYQFTPEMWERFAQEAAHSLQQQTGTPAEDIALNAVPVIERAIKQVMGG